MKKETVERLEGEVLETVYEARETEVEVEAETLVRLEEIRLAEDTVKMLKKSYKTWMKGL